jgi:hypothetical protein
MRMSWLIWSTKHSVCCPVPAFPSSSSIGVPGEEEALRRGRDEGGESPGGPTEEIWETKDVTLVMKDGLVYKGVRTVRPCPTTGQS